MHCTDILFAGIISPIDDNVHLGPGSTAMFGVVHALCQCVSAPPPSTPSFVVVDRVLSHVPLQDREVAFMLPSEGCEAR